MERCFNTTGSCNPVEHYTLLALDWMPAFDPDPAKSWDEKLYVRDVESGGKKIHVVGL